MGESTTDSSNLFVLAAAAAVVSDPEKAAVPCPAPLFLGEKTITETDYANRFLFSKEMTDALKTGGGRQLLSNEEEMRIFAKNECFPVLLFDAERRCYEVELSFWPSNAWLIIKGINYRKFTRNCHLVPKTRVGVWAFRRGDVNPQTHSALCFAIAGAIPAPAAPAADL